MALETILHVVPTGDLIEHDASGEPCVCGATREVLIGATGTTGTLVTHFSLDGREMTEVGQNIPLEPGLNHRRCDPGE